MTHFGAAKACAPGQRLELAMATAYWGRRGDESLTDHAGMLSTSAAHEKKV